MHVHHGDHPSSDLARIIPTHCNTSEETICDHIRDALGRGLPIIKPVPPHDGVAVIIGGGPSVKDEMKTLQELHGATVFALNGAGLWLQSIGIIPHALFMMDARPLNARFLKGLDPRTHLYLSTMCHRDVFDAAEENGNPVTTWHPIIDENDGLGGISEDRGTVVIGGGATIGLRALLILHVIGYRTVHLFGYDSSYADGASHAYPQAENDDDKPQGCMTGGRWFAAPAWMIQQANAFPGLAADLRTEGMTIHVHGDGLLPEVARQMNKPERAAEEATAIHSTVKVHPFAHVDDTVKIGAGTRVWQFASVIRGTVLGQDCNVASGALLDGPRFGDRCIICQNVAMGPGFLFGNDCFIGPNVTICNDAFPVTSKEGFDIERFRAGFWTVVVKDGASIGANAVVLPGVTIGAGAMIAAGAVVDRSVPDRMLFTRDGKLRALPERLPPRMKVAY